MMSKAIKNFEILGDSSKHVPIAHQRPVKLDDLRTRPQDLNLWKIFSKVPRTRSVKQNQQKVNDKDNTDQEQLIVISTFKNSQCSTDSPSKQFRVYNKNPIKRYISDEGFTLNIKVDGLQRIIKIKDQSNSCNPMQSSVHISNYPSSPINYQNSVDHAVYKRNNVSGNCNQLKSKFKINRDNNKRQNRNIQKTASKIKLPELKQEKKYPVLTKQADDLKDLKSESYLLMEYPSQRVIVGHRASTSLEIASLTKIMTYYTIVKFAGQRNLNLKNQMVIVSMQVQNIGGTSAELIEGDQYTVDQLLYGLMLPSGNDAANQLAYWMGAYIVGGTDLKLQLKAFVTQMNKNAVSLGLKQTKFANPHGLPNNGAKSTAVDVAKLCCICIKSEHFRQIVKQQFYKLKVKNGTIEREVIWQNTNKLLRRTGFVGLKTGITVTAGPCLAAAYDFRDKTYISIVLRASKVSARFKDTRMLLYWALTKLFKHNLSDNERNILKYLKKNDNDLDSDYSEDQHEFRYNCGDSSQLRRRCKILSNQL